MIPVGCRFSLPFAMALGTLLQSGQHVVAELPDHVLSALPPGNRSILNAVAEHARAGQRNQNLSTIFSSLADRDAFKLLENGSNWQQYFDVVVPRRPVSSSDLIRFKSGSLLKFPYPSTANASQLGRTPLPGDVIEVSGNGRRSLAIWCENRAFASITKKKGKTAWQTSFFYYPFLQSAGISAPTMQSNSFPPRINSTTLGLFRRWQGSTAAAGTAIDPAKIKLVSGFVAVPLNGAYAGYYWPVRTWKAADPQFMVLRRKAATSQTYVLNVRRRWVTTQSTISEFDFAGAGISGFILENPGPSTTAIGQRKRIPAGTYQLVFHDGPNIKNVYKLYNEKVPQLRGILIHGGPEPSGPGNTRGCLIPGSSKGPDKIFGVHETLAKINNFIGQVGPSNVRVEIRNAFDIQDLVGFVEEWLYEYLRDYKDDDDTSKYYSSKDKLYDLAFLHGGCQLRAIETVKAISEYAKLSELNIKTYKLFTISKKWLDKPHHDFNTYPVDTIQPLREGKVIRVRRIGNGNAGPEVVQWGFHVAAAFDFAGESDYVLDLGLFRTAVSPATWRASQRDASLGGRPPRMFNANANIRVPNVDKDDNPATGFVNYVP